MFWLVITMLCLGGLYFWALMSHIEINRIDKELEEDEIWKN